MNPFVDGAVRSLGREYADGTLNLEINVPIESAGVLPLHMGKRVPIRLRVDDVEYTAGLRATKKHKRAWICPDVYTDLGVKVHLGTVLVSAGFRPNDRVQLAVDGQRITVRHVPS